MKMKIEKKMIKSMAFANIVLVLCASIGGLMIRAGDPFVGLAIMSFGMLFFMVYTKMKQLKTPEMNDELMQLIKGKSAHLTIEVTLPVICILFLAVANLPIEISATHAVGFISIFYMAVYFVSLRYYSKKYT